MWNIPFNGLSVVQNVLTDQLVQNPETRALCRALMLEVAEGAAACARPIGPDFIEKMMADTEKMKPYAPSMKLDFDRGNTLEIESILRQSASRSQSRRSDHARNRKALPSASRNQSRCLDRVALSG